MTWQDIAPYIVQAFIGSGGVIALAIAIINRRPTEITKKESEATNSDKMVRTALAIAESARADTKELRESNKALAQKTDNLSHRVDVLESWKQRALADLRTMISQWQWHTKAPLPIDPAPYQGEDKT